MTLLKLTNKISITCLHLISNNNSNIIISPVKWTYKNQKNMKFSVRGMINHHAWIFSFVKQFSVWSWTWDSQPCNMHENILLVVKSKDIAIYPYMFTKKLYSSHCLKNAQGLLQVHYVLYAFVWFFNFYIFWFIWMWHNHSTCLSLSCAILSTQK